MRLINKGKSDNGFHLQSKTYKNYNKITLIINKLAIYKKKLVLKYKKYYYKKFYDLNVIFNYIIFVNP